jgi:hypothetical protein
VLAGSLARPGDKTEQGMKPFMEVTVDLVTLNYENTADAVIVTHVTATKSDCRSRYGYSKFQ